MKPLKPVMAALLAAASAAFALPGISHAATDIAGCPRPASETDPRNVLSCFVAQDPVVRQDIGERLARFVESKNPSGEYDYLLIHDNTDLLFLPTVAKAAQAWPDAVLNNKGSAGDIAVLYFVLGPDGEQPAWAKNSPLLAGTLKKGMKWHDNLQERLAAAGYTKDARIPPSVVDKGGITGFLNDAVKHAKAVFDDQRTQKQIQESVEAGNVTGETPPTIYNKANPLDSTGSGFGFDDLYRSGAKVGDKIYGPHDTGFRTLSMKVYATREKDRLINKVCVVDITAGDITSPSVQQCFDMTPGDKELVMREGGRRYTVSVAQDGEVTLKRPDGADGAKTDDGSMKTSLGELADARNAQIRKGGTVSIGEPPMPYYVIGQGGTKGSFMFFSQAKMNSLPSCKPYTNECDPRPDLMGDVAQVLPGDNSTVPTTSKPALGAVNGVDYHLELDPRTHMWKVVKGVGDKPSDGTPSESTGTAHGGHGSGSGDSTNTPLMSELLQLPAFKDWKDHDGEDGYGNDTINDDMKEKFKVMTDKGGLYYAVSPQIPKGSPAYALHLQDPKTKADFKMRAFNEWVAVETDVEIDYYDLPGLVSIVDASAPKSPLAGRYIKDGTAKGMSDTTDVDVAVDIIKTYMKKDIEAKDLKPGVDRYAPEGSYSLSANVDGDKFIVMIKNTKTHKDCSLIPDLGKCTDSAGNTSETAKAPDQAADPDGASKAFTGCRANTTEPDGKTVVGLYTDHSAAKTSIGTQDHDVCLYERKSDPKHPSFILTLNYTTENNANQSTADIFGEALPKPAQFSYKSTLDKMPVSTPHPEIGPVEGSNADHGVYGLYQSGSSNPNFIGKDKPGDCLGAVVWWGLSEADALKACRDRVIQTPKNWKNAWHIFG